ncbi:unnamed protein product [Diabrotica balteata]|uniref:C-type lectin domain-containing protein n=1 Tax=Diabrotica balteata TaxID=107213 RepID=A0A9N9XGW1_DIABA|nr:unnamed protein product [Diabrotica balteata]
MYLKLFLIFFICNIVKVNLESGEPFVSPILTPKPRPSNVFSYNGKRYYIGSVFKANYFKATQYCREQGMQLLSISNHLENEKLGKFIGDKGLALTWFWTSGTNLVNDWTPGTNLAGEWVWLSTGQQYTYTNWFINEPSNVTSDNRAENCMIAFLSIGQHGFAWNDVVCETKCFFICETISNCS